MAEITVVTSTLVELETTLLDINDEVTQLNAVGTVFSGIASALDGGMFDGLATAIRNSYQAMIEGEVADVYAAASAVRTTRVAYEEGDLDASAVWTSQGVA